MGRLSGKNILIIIPKDYYNEEELEIPYELFKSEDANIIGNENRAAYARPPDCRLYGRNYRGQLRYGWNRDKTNQGCVSRSGHCGRYWSSNLSLGR